MSVGDADTEDSKGGSQSSFCSSIRRKARRKSFREAWLVEPNFKPWIEMDRADNFKARCKVCQKVITAGKSELMRHMTSVVHRANMVRNQVNNGEQEPATSTFADKDEQLLTDVKAGEIRICLEAIEQDHSFNSCAHSIDVSKAWMDTSIVRNVRLGRTKMSAIVKNVINKYLVCSNLKNIRQKPFSLLIDETTDVGDIKNVCILIKHFSEQRIQTYLLDLIRIREGTPENVYKCLRHVLEKNDLPLKNMVGICVDNASVTVARHNSLLRWLLGDNNEIAVFSCTYHSIQLVARRASEHIPEIIEDLMHRIYTYFTKNLKSKAILNSMQEFMREEQNKMLQPSKTRWSALFQCVQRILQQWNVLFSLFAEASIEESSTTPKLIFTIMNDPFTKAYLCFLHFILETFVDFNSFFQSDDILIHSLMSESIRFLRLLGGKFIKRELVMNNLENVDVYNEDNLCGLYESRIGSEAEQIISEIKNASNASDTGMDKITEFYKNIRKFYQTSFVECRNRLSIQEPFLHSLVFLTPEIALNHKTAENLLDPILNTYKTKFNNHKVKNEWDDLPFMFLPEEKEELMALDVCQFWHRIATLKNNRRELQFQNIAEVASVCLALPHSNADVEKYFSTVYQVKTNFGKKSQTETIGAITRIKLALQNEKKHYYDYEIEPGMLDFFNSNMYKKETVPVELAGVLLGDGTEESGKESEEGSIKSEVGSIKIEEVWIKSEN